MDCSESVNEMLDDFKGLLNDDLQKPVQSFTKCIKAKHIHAKAKAITCGDEFWHAFILCKDKLPMDKMMRPIEPIKLVIEQLFTMLPNALPFAKMYSDPSIRPSSGYGEPLSGYGPTPEYLYISGYEKCISSVNLGNYTSLCLPREKPNACLKDAWDQIKDICKVKCPSVTEHLPTPNLSDIPDWKECLGFYNPYACMVSPFAEGICLDAEDIDLGYKPSRCNEILCLRRCSAVTYCSETDKSDAADQPVSDQTNEEMTEDTSEIAQSYDEKEAEDALEEEEIDAEGSGSEDDNVEYSKEQEDEYEEEEEEEEEEESLEDDDEYEEEEEHEETEDEYEEEEE